MGASCHEGWRVDESLRRQINEKSIKILFVLLFENILIDTEKKCVNYKYTLLIIDIWK